MTAPTPSSPDPDHSRRSSPSYHGHGGRYGGGQPGSHRRGDPADGDHRAYPYGASDAPDASGSAGVPGYPSAPRGYGYTAAYASDGAYGPVHPEDPGVEERPDMRREVRTGSLCVLILIVLGVGLGLLWLWLAPRVPLVSVDNGVFLKDPEGEEAIGADGTFVLLAVAFGLVTGVVAFLRGRGGGIGVVVGLAVGALLGSVLAWQLGVWLGPSSDLAASAKAAGENKTFDGPLKLQAKGALLVWPFITLATHLVLTGVFGHRDPEPAAPLPPKDGEPQQHW
ncbi:hypothetical protein [Streptomyces winkii]|uniref:hypothetical protein n=1 Tax=Streptomyces winkii TaxID=3051178 RepID=UPI0028D490BA|nr:hypothetical protein [Streptomyces sp. DSM 40971]